VAEQSHRREPTTRARGRVPEQAHHPEQAHGREAGRYPDYGQPTTPTQTVSAFALGWSMAELFGPLAEERAGAEPRFDHLPTVSELPVLNRMLFAADEIAGRLRELGAIVAELGRLNADALRTAVERGVEPARAELRALHERILRRLVPAPAAQLAAYQLGLALHETCWLPRNERADPMHFLQRVRRSRLSVLQDWLTQAGGGFAGNSAGTVARSLELWQDWADVNAWTLRVGWNRKRDVVLGGLGTQARSWHRLLTAPADATGQPAIGAWVQAGESMLRTARTLAWRILRRCWPLVVLLLAATGGLLYLAIANGTGATKVWSSLVTVAASVGVTGAGLRGTGRRAMGMIEQQVWRAAETDARAWNITWLPILRQGPIRRYRLGSRGVALPRGARRLPRDDAPPAAA
jgi:hypothetical protein